MLGQDRLTFETPNVIDPGEQPPGRPIRTKNISHSPPDLSPTSASSSRLLRDLSDIDGLPQDDEPYLEEPYDPYQEDEDEDEGPDKHSLPHPDEMRLHATRLLTPPTTKQTALGRTVVLDHPNESRHLVRRKILSVCWKVSLLLVLVVAFIVVAAALVNSSNNNDSTTSGRPFLRLPNTPGYTLREDLINFFADSGISPVEAMLDPDTPQHQAILWMSSVDRIEYADATQQVQRYVLATFFFSLNGLNWTDSINFVTNQHECAWSRETMITKGSDHELGESGAFGVSCDDNLEVQTLYLPGNSLKGNLPSELQFLPQLELLAVPDNQITGTLPQDIWSSLPSLKYLDVRYNKLVGNIPASLGECEGLRMVGFSNNQLVGSIPDSFANLQRVQTLALDDNTLTGDLSAIKHWYSLEFLYANTNSLKGKLDDEFMKESRRLRQLDLSDNLFTGSVPTHLLQHDSLLVLDVAKNGLTGPLPYELRTNENLQFLSLRENQISGTISFSGLPLLTKLTHLDLHGNLMEGTLPNEIGTMSALKYLSLGSNNWKTGNIPSAVFELEELRELLLPDSQLSGDVPVFVYLLPNLETIDLSHNSLGGRIPFELWRLQNLRYVLLDNNKFTGQVPVEVASKNSIELLTLHKNGFVGTADPLCENSPNLFWVAMDCSIECSQDCCPTCCPADSEDDCFDDSIAKYLSWYEGEWEYNYERPSYDFDPILLSPDSLFSIIQEGNMEGSMEANYSP